MIWECRQCVARLKVCSRRNVREVFSMFRIKGRVIRVQTFVQPPQKRNS